MLGKLDARGFPDVFKDAAAWLVSVRGDGDLVLVAHNGDDFDFPVLDALAEDAGLEPLNCARLDTYKIARQ
jgi:DNA polymerase III epsilon subunit-like protein